MVFTLPHGLNAVIQCNEALGYDLLFKAAAQSVKELCEDEKYLGATPGMMAILHTWGQNLMYHPHIHCIISAGGLTKDRYWKQSRDGFFLPVKVVSRLFRGKFLSLLTHYYAKGKLKFYGSATSLSETLIFKTLMRKLYAQEWVVYAKKPFGGPAQVLSYLGRYTHRVAIANHRLIKMENDQVYFRWKEYRQQGQQKVMNRTAERLNTKEFMRRFLMHILPPGFCKIRYFGFLATRNRKERLKHIREILKYQADKLPRRTWQEWFYQLTGIMPGYCPQCKEEVLITIEVFQPAREPPYRYEVKIA